MLFGAADQVAHVVRLVQAKRSGQVTERGGRVSMSEIGGQIATFRRGTPLSPGFDVHTIMLRNRPD